LGLAASAVVAPGLWAQTFSAKPIRWVVVAPAGSSLDVIARAMQDKLRDQLGTPIVIENKPQVGGTAGTAEVAQSAPDGHTWVMSFNGPLAFAPHLYPRLPYAPLRDLTPVVLTTSQPNLIAVNASLPANNLQELLALLRANPGKYNFASVGNGSSSHLCMEYIKALSGTFAVHIPFNGGPPSPPRSRPVGSRLSRSPVCNATASPLRCPL